MSPDRSSCQVRRTFRTDVLVDKVRSRFIHSYRSPSAKSPDYYLLGAQDISDARLRQTLGSVPDRGFYQKQALRASWDGLFGSPLFRISQPRL